MPKEGSRGKSHAASQAVAFDVESFPPRERFINRELSWLAFNARVLGEARNPRHPVLERVRFLSISASNLDEFYMVRVAGLKGQVNAGVVQPSADGLTPQEQLDLINESVRGLFKAQDDAWEELKGLLAHEGIFVVRPEDLSPEDVHELEERFMEHIFPVFTPLAIDPAHPFPFIPNLGHALVLQLVRIADGESMRALVPIPPQVQRFVRLKGQATRFILVEDVVLMFSAALFPGFKVVQAGHFRVIRDSEMEIDEEAQDLVLSFESALKRRRRGTCIRLAVHGMTPEQIKLICDELEVSPEDSFAIDGMVGQTDLKQLIIDERADLLFPPYNARFPERIRDFGGDCFAAIRQKDIVVHHPYESFDVVVQFLRQAARDPNVLSIKQTLYRTSKDSPIVKALVEAAEAGKSVTAMVELKARFDEETNINWAAQLEAVGAHVVYGVVGHKCHAKMMLIVRRTTQNGKSMLKRYAHLGTGNYHPRTARLYSDFGLMTADQRLCEDVHHVFQQLTGIGGELKLHDLWQSPFTLHPKLVEAIRAEADNARAGKKARIVAKMNALLEPTVIAELYEASQAGVKIDLIVRGVCSLQPGVEGLSENISVRSIVGRFLEHHRIFYFFANGQEQVYLSSADWMDRNFFRRVEVAFPIKDRRLKRRVIAEGLSSFLGDNQSAWVMQSDGHYRRSRPGKTSRNAQTSLLLKFGC
jgi:polyphosphate kinase